MTIDTESNRYTILKELGSGSFGKVHQAIDQNGEDVAIKTLEPSHGVLDAINKGFLTSDDLDKRFSKEIRHQRKIAHPNVVRILDANIDSQPPFFVMELADCTLKADLDNDRTLGGNPKDALFDILAGLEAIHKIGISHRDLKPLNVLKFPTEEGKFRYAISDFGLMSAAGGDTTTLTATGVGGGTVNYAAPELINNLKRATAASDIYSFGVILHDVFGGGAHRIPYTEVDLPGPLGAIASKCTKKLPIRRYQNIAELRADLYAVLSDEKIVFHSNAEEKIVELLDRLEELTEAEWDRIFLFIDGNQGHPYQNHLVFRAFRKTHFEDLRDNAPDLLSAFSLDFCEYIHHQRGRVDFSYCDVLSDKLSSLFESGDTAIKASTLLALLVLGTSHNRWVVERKFMEFAGAQLSDDVASKFLTDVETHQINLPDHIDHVERSISISRTNLHPMIQAAALR